MDVVDHVGILTSARRRSRARVIELQGFDTRGAGEGVVDTEDDALMCAREPFQPDEKRLAAGSHEKAVWIDAPYRKMGSVHEAGK